MSPIPALTRPGPPALLRCADDGLVSSPYRFFLRRLISRHALLVYRMVTTGRSHSCDLHGFPGFTPRSTLALQLGGKQSGRTGTLRGTGRARQALPEVN